MRSAGISPDELQLDADVDGTEQGRAQEGYRESEHFASLIVDALSAQIAILDETGKIVAVNRAWRQFAESNGPMATNVFEGANYLQECDSASGEFAEGGATVAEGIRAVIREQQPSFAFEYPCHSPNKKRWFVARVTRFRGDGPIRVMVTYEDVTDRKQAELRYRSLYEQSRDALMILDPSSLLYTAANPSAIAMFGARDEADFLSRAPWHYSPARQPNGRDSAELAMEVGAATVQEGSRTFEWTHARIDGTEFPAAVLLTLIEWPGKTLLQATVRDISLEKRMELERAARLARQEGISVLQQSLLARAPLEEKLESITDEVVRLFDADFCRIWLIRPGDLCQKGCAHAEVLEGPHVCRDRTSCLHLVASSGRYTHIDGKDHRRVPLGCYKIGQFAAWDEHRVTINDVQNDARIHNREWARELGLVSFAGYQLRAQGGKTLGVLALFARHPISPVDLAMLDGLSSTAARVVLQAEAEEELQDTNNRYNSLFARSLALFYIVDFEGRVIDANDAVFKLLGYRREEIRCLDFRSLLSEDQLPLAFKTVEEIREAGYQKTPTEFRLRHKDGSILYVETTGSTVISKGEAVGIQNLAYDITERKRAEEKARLLLTELDRSNKELGQFAYVASHDLQEPLRMVSSYTQLLSRRYKGRLDASADEFIAYAVDGANRMQTLINDLLAYSRVGTRGKEFEPTDCTAIINLALANLKAAIEESSSVITHGPLPTVMADKMQFGQLLQNLIGNAVKYHGAERPRVHVSAEQKGNEWIFSIRDNGIGIEPQYADRIFVIFQRLHTREEYAGTGIGLAICKKIVERHGGRIWVESQVGSGATFYFTIPIGNTDHERSSV